MARACAPETTLLGIAEKPVDEQPLREALEAQAELAEELRVSFLEIVIRSGEPIRQILEETSTRTYDLVVIGRAAPARRVCIGVREKPTK